MAFAAKFVLKKNDEVFKRILTAAKTLSQHGAYVKAGVTGPKAQADRGDGSTNVQIALAHEFGVPEKNIARRSWIGASFRLHHDEYRKMLAEVAKNALLGKSEYLPGLGRIGAKMAADIKLFVRERLVNPQLDPAGKTYQRKLAKGRGRGTPIALIDSNQMVRSVTWETVNK